MNYIDSQSTMKRMKIWHSNRNETQLPIANAYTKPFSDQFSCDDDNLVQKCSVKCQNRSAAASNISHKRGRVSTWFISFGSHGRSQCNLSLAVFSNSSYNKYATQRNIKEWRNFTFQWSICFVHAFVCILHKATKIAHSLNQSKSIGFTLKTHAQFRTSKGIVSHRETIKIEWVCLFRACCVVFFYSSSPFFSSCIVTIVCTP